MYEKWLFNISKKKKKTVYEGFFFVYTKLSALESVFLPWPVSWEGSSLEANSSGGLSPWGRAREKGSPDIERSLKEVAGGSGGTRRRGWISLWGGEWVLQEGAMGAAFERLEVILGFWGWGFGGNEATECPTEEKEQGEKWVPGFGGTGGGTATVLLTKLGPVRRERGRSSRWEGGWRVAVPPSKAKVTLCNEKQKETDIMTIFFFLLCMKKC